MNNLQFESVLFNFHDVILMMISLQCLFFALLLWLTNSKQIKSTFFLAAFLFAHSLIPINELMMWGAEFKIHARQQLSSLYFAPGIVYYLDGPLLFLCVKSLVFRDFILRRTDLLHLLPFTIYCLFIGLSFYGNPLDIRLEMLNSESFVYSTNYVSIEFLSKLIRFSYVIACFILISRYGLKLQEKHSNMEKAHISWLQALVAGFMIVMLFELILSASKIFTHYHYIYFYIGLTRYYTTFFLVNLLVFTAIRFFGMFEQVNEEDLPKKSTDEFRVNPEEANLIDEQIKQEYLYMEPDITLDSLADTLKIMPRDLSMIINRHFGANFYTFINGYRIEQAKKMLKDPAKRDTTITDIYLAVGFNSKSVFYTFFRKIEGMTPTKYRQLN
ncbi:MAG: helix-turn-helix domain-containing protein [Porticoccaceae bacterium]|nr:helix-turn-helix domain-containing protein [Porticoccaceae bacterium]